MPCYLDEMSPRSWDFPEGHRYGERPYDFGKIWWSLHLAQLGYASLYLDNDVAAIKDPLAADIVQSPYDLQVTSSGTCIYSVAFAWHHLVPLDSVRECARRPDVLPHRTVKQGLSDFRAGELPRVGAILDDRCKLYRLKQDRKIPGGDCLSGTLQRHADAFTWHAYRLLLL